MSRFSSDERVAVPENDDNNTLATAQDVTELLTGIPAANYVDAAIDEGGDSDWFSIDVEAGKTYVVEIFDAEAILAQTSESRRCENNNTQYSGLWMTLTNVGGVIETRVCTPNGAASGHTTAKFTASANGAYRLNIQAHSAQVAGAYRFRILPEHDQGGAWDENLEPNNAWNTAMPIMPGYECASSAEFEEREVVHATTRADRDWYVFEATAGQSYNVELFNVEKTMVADSQSRTCVSNNTQHAGAFLVVKDAAGAEFGRQCASNGTGDIHTRILVTATADGPLLCAHSTAFGPSRGELLNSNFAPS